MRYEFYDNKLGAVLGLTDNIKADEQRFSITEWTIKFLWNRNDKPVNVRIDDRLLTLLPNQI